MHERYHIPLLFVLALSVASGLLLLRHETYKHQTAGVWFQESISAEQLLTQYETLKRTEKRQSRAKNTDQIRILIVPGHDTENRGAYFEDVWEADMNVAVGNILHSLFSVDPRFESTLLRDKNGYHKSFLTYKESHASEIQEEVSEKKAEMQYLVKQGRVTSHQTIHHNTALPEIAQMLYAINIYANEHEYDIVLHLHFNDYPGSVGEYKHSGFSVYIPESQYSNASASKELGMSIASQLETQFPHSSHPLETGGVVETQELIAVGAFNTLNSAVALIEYGYIYENQFQLEDVRDIVFMELATHTYHGVKNFFEQDAPKDIDVFVPTEHLATPLKKGDEGIAVFALQRILQTSGHYPPTGENVYSCPVSGYFGSCTTRAVQEFQSAHALPETGYFGEMTLEKLLGV